MFGPLKSLTVSVWLPSSQSIQRNASSNRIQLLRLMLCEGICVLFLKHVLISTSLELRKYLASILNRHTDHTHPSGGTIALSSSLRRLLQVLWSAGIGALLLAYCPQTHFPSILFNFARFLLCLFNFVATYTDTNLPFDYQLFLLIGSCL